MCQVALTLDRGRQVFNPSGNCAPKVILGKHSEASLKDVHGSFERT